MGANDRVNVGLIGCGGRGRLVAKLMREVPNVEIAAVCDVFDPQAAAAQERAGPGCRSYRDFRNLIEQKGVDAVVIATPDHWHAIPAVLAPGRTTSPVPPARFSAGSSRGSDGSGTPASCSSTPEIFSRPEAADWKML